MGLRHGIRRGLPARVDPYQTLDHAIEAAARFESQLPPRGRGSMANTPALVIDGLVDEDGSEADWCVDCNPAFAVGLRTMF